MSEMPGDWIVAKIRVPLNREAGASGCAPSGTECLFRSNRTCLIFRPRRHTISADDHFFRESNVGGAIDSVVNGPPFLNQVFRRAATVQVFRYRSGSTSRFTATDPVSMPRADPVPDKAMRFIRLPASWSSGPQQFGPPREVD